MHPLSPHAGGGLVRPVVWHRHHSFYWAGEYPLHARPLPGRCWSAGYNLTLSPDRDATEAWADRHLFLWTTKFPSLGELKATVEAVLAVDPLPADRIFPEKLLRRETPGTYHAQLGEHEFRAVRTECGQWQVFQDDNPLDAMPTLFAVRTFISGMCRRDLLRALSAS